MLDCADSALRCSSATVPHAAEPRETAATSTVDLSPIVPSNGRLPRLPCTLDGVAASVPCAARSARQVQLCAQAKDATVGEANRPEEGSRPPLLVEAHVHPRVVNERLGRTAVSITLDTYSHVIPAIREQAAERIAGLVLLAR